jgi:hypothetical protein
LTVLFIYIVFRFWWMAGWWWVHSGLIVCNISTLSGLILPQVMVCHFVLCYHVSCFLQWRELWSLYLHLLRHLKFLLFLFFPCLPFEFLLSFQLLQLLNFMLLKYQVCFTHF